MKKFIISLAFIAQCSIINVWAQTFYAVFDNDKTLTFYYDTQADSRKGTIYNEEYDEDGYPKWWVERYDVTKVVFDYSVTRYKPTTCKNWFETFVYLEEIEGLEYLDTSKATDMSGMFYHDVSLKSLDLSNFDTRNVTTMHNMFSGCHVITSLDVSKFNTGNVRDMSYMFEGCNNLKTLDVSHFNTTKVMTMYGMFSDCFSLITLDVSNFDMQYVVKVNEMFQDCKNLVTIYCDKDWKRDDISGDNMFRGCSNLRGGIGTKYDSSKTDINYAHPDEKGNPGAFAKNIVTIGGYNIMDDGTLPSTIPCIVSGSVVWSSDDNELTLKNAVIETDGEGIYAPNGISIVTMGINVINSGGNGITIAGGDATISGNNSNLYINSANGYGISVNDMLETDGEVTLEVKGKNGALDGRKRYSQNLQAWRFGHLSPKGGVLILGNDDENPIIHDIGSIEGIDSDCFFSYLEYLFNTEKHTVVTPYDKTPVTHPFKIVCEEPEGYGIYLGGFLINADNYTTFNPQSLTEGNAWYDPDKSILTLKDAKFDSPYWSSEDYYALYAHKNNLHILLKGENDLVGKADGCDYGIWLEQQGSGKQCNWTITSQDGATLRINGDIFMNNDNSDSKLTIDNVDITCKDYCHFWCEDDVNVEIINSSLELWDKEYGQTEKFSWYLIGALETLTLKDCHFEDACYWDTTKGVVKNSQGKDETYHVKIVRGEANYKKGDVNGDGKVNTADVVAVYSFIEKGTASGFTREAANVNGDTNGDVNTADVVAIYDIIIKGGQ